MLQHPDEKKHSKNTAIIAGLCLKHYQCWNAEDFSEHKLLNRYLEKHDDGTMLVYPSESAVDLQACMDGGVDLNHITQLIFIDATWRKAKKIWSLSKNLHKLPAVKLSAELCSNYRIRKIPQQGYLSTIEAIYYSLTVLEQSEEKYQPLLEIFQNMIDKQIDHMGQETFKKNYESKHV